MNGLGHVPGLDVHYTDTAQRLYRVGQELDDLDRDLYDLSHVSDT